MRGMVLTTNDVAGHLFGLGAKAAGEDHSCVAQVGGRVNVFTEYPAFVSKLIDEQHMRLVAFGIQLSRIQAFEARLQCAEMAFHSFQDSVAEIKRGIKRAKA